MLYVPKRVFLTKGVGTHKEELHSFELALRDANIEKYNLVSVSSIFPPGCKTIPRSHGVKLLQPGQILFCVMSRISSNEHGRLIAASVGCASISALVATSRNGIAPMPRLRIKSPMKATIAGLP